MICPSSNFNKLLRKVPKFRSQLLLKMAVLNFSHWTCRRSVVTCSRA